MKRTKVIDILKSTEFGKDVCVKGWVRTHRSSKAVDFIALNDGSTINNVQLVCDTDKFDAELLKQITTGACICAVGTPSKAKAKVRHLKSNAATLRFMVFAVLTILCRRKDRHLSTCASMRTSVCVPTLSEQSCAYATTWQITIHTFFHNKGYFYFHTPLITASDCEGAGQMFQVTTKNLYNLKKDENGQIMYDDDFFGKQTSLTVSGQLEGELGATALGGIYTFGPTFRAENSNTPRHLAEFWMIEPEIAFMDLDELMDLEEEFIKYCVQWALDNCKDDLEFLNKMIDKGLLERLQGVVNTEFVRLPYTKGIEILQEAIKGGKKFDYPCNWGDDLASEHERYLVEEYFKKPVIMTNYPKEIKAFYMKIDAEKPVCMGKEMEETVQGTDVLFPQIGEIIGGSVREESYDKLMGEIERRNIPMKDMSWYLDTRKYGSCPHAGFGLGFERLILFVTGMQNIRDVIPFPRTPNNAEF